MIFATIVSIARRACAIRRLKRVGAQRGMKSFRLPCGIIASIPKRTAGPAASACDDTSVLNTISPSILRLRCIISSTTSSALPGGSALQRYASASAASPTAAVCASTCFL
ncbi:cytochrome P450 family domain protein [Burkholderia mallei]|nr:cytochrome P450 family domain protein [Burkholderia mallei]KOS91692.1 cytochrome P450 family domain protein [Burkholderia mallei]KOT07218.1 cytochrome P450 family domain protein [Burkholderia mallei]